MEYYRERRSPLSANFALAENIASASRSRRWKQRLVSHSFPNALDRVNVLGDDDHGHTGCVNALSWARDGELLLSGGDDTTVRVWSLDPSDTTTEYPFVCQSVIRTGHRANIFNVQMLPFSSRIATVAGDGQVRVCDVGHGVGSSPDGKETLYTPNEALFRAFRCHHGRVKRIVTEESADLFLTVAEDGTVRQHDLRASHTCRGSCPSPLTKLPFDLSSLSLSTLTPYQYTVAGDSPYGFLFDRRHAGRFLEEEWGMPLNREAMTTCVRRFGRRSRAPGERRGTEHVTGTRMSAYNGHEVLLTYSGDAVYLYSTLDDVESESSVAWGTRDAIIPPNSKRRKLDPEPIPIVGPSSDVEMLDVTDASDGVSSRETDFLADQDDHAEMDTDDDLREEDEDEEDEEESDKRSGHSKVPIVMPRSRFEGACNVETVKDVNFLGPRDEYVASGSDDGNFFLWNKSTHELHGIWEGDGSIVNVVEGHPHLPLVAVSGIDYTVKLFSPVHRRSAFSRMDNAESIVRRNARASCHTNQPIQLASLFRQIHFAISGLPAQTSRRPGGAGAAVGEDEDEDAETQCPTQ